MGLEDATRGESQSNGLIEGYVGKIRAHARTMRTALERQYPGLHAKHPASLLTALNRQGDGMTLFERSTGLLWKPSCESLERPYQL